MAAKAKKSAKGARKERSGGSRRTGGCVVLLNLDKDTPRGDPVRAAFLSAGVLVKTATVAQLADPVGSVAGLVGFRPALKPWAGEVPPAAREPFILFCELPRSLFDEALAALRESGVTVDNKAVVTKTNKTWSLARLIETVSQEHAALNAL